MFYLWLSELIRIHDLYSKEDAYGYWIVRNRGPLRGKFCVGWFQSYQD